MKKNIFLMIAVSILISFTSCNKESAVIEQTSIDLADDDAVTDAVFEDVFNTVDNADIILDDANKGDGSKSLVVVSDSCPSITIDPVTPGVWPKTITIDYGTGCTVLYGNTRSGKIIIEVTGPRMEEGSVKTVTFEDYFFNGIKVEGTKVLENMGYNSNQNLVFAVQLTAGKLTLPDGNTIERAFQHERECIAGQLTRNIWDDECLITGTATGKNINGITYTNTIITALHWKRACVFIIAGVVKIERAGTEPVELNYGTGECDAKAVVTRNGESKEILLRNRHRNMEN